MEDGKDLGQFLLLFAYRKKWSFKNCCFFLFIMFTVNQRPQSNLKFVNILLYNTFIGIKGLQVYKDYITKLICSVRHRYPPPSCINKTFLQHMCYHNRHLLCKRFVNARGETMSEKWKTVKMGGVNSHGIQGPCKNALSNRQAHMICQFFYCFIC